MYHYDHISKDEIDIFLKDLAIVNGKIYVTNVETAEWFVQTYYKEVIAFFLHPLNVYGYDQLAAILKIALDKEIISRDDLLKTDDEVMSLLRNSEDSLIQQSLKALHP